MPVSYCLHLLCNIHILSTAHLYIHATIHSGLPRGGQRGAVSPERHVTLLQFLFFKLINGLQMLVFLFRIFQPKSDYRFSHNFNCTSPVCRCGVDDETNVHYLLRCPLYLAHRNILLSNVSDILNSNVEILPDIHLTQILLYGSKAYKKIVNQLIIRETIRFIKSTGRFAILEAFPH